MASRASPSCLGSQVGLAHGSRQNAGDVAAHCCYSPSQPSCAPREARGLYPVVPEPPHPERSSLPLPPATESGRSGAAWGAGSGNISLQKHSPERDRMCTLTHVHTHMHSHTRTHTHRAATDKHRDFSNTHIARSAHRDLEGRLPGGHGLSRSSSLPGLSLSLSLTRPITSFPRRAGPSLTPQAHPR